MLYKPEEFLALQTVDVPNDERYLLIKGGKHIIHLTLYGRLLEAAKKKNRMLRIFYR